MEEKPAEEFDRVERHGALPIPPLIIFPPKGDFARVTGEQTSIRDGYPMRVPRQIAEHLLRPGQGGLGIDDPFGLPQGGHKLSPRGRGREGLTRPMQVQSILAHGVAQHREEGAPEKTAEDPDREEETVRTGNPGRAITSQPACRDEAMNMRMMVQRLSPGV